MIRKMLRRRYIFIWALFTFLHVNLSHGDPKIHKCPIGFLLSYTTSKGDPICYRRKERETFNEIYRDCVGNLYSSKLFDDLNITRPDHTIWSEYKTYYPGGPFIDKSNTKTFGIELNLTGVTLDPNLDLDEELCLVIDSVQNYTAVNCNEKHYRYCFVEPYPDHDDMSHIGCEELKDSWRFRSPESTCLSILDGVGGGAVRATWNQARKLCTDKGGSLLHRGWIYTNSPVLNSGVIPLGVVMSADFSMLRYDGIEDRSEIPSSKWNFADLIHNADTSLGAQHDDFWYLVNSSYVFYQVVCERPLPLRNVSLDITVDLENKLILSTNVSLDDDDILCYTDSTIRYPLKVSKKRVGNHTYIIKPKKNGYYWCTHRDVTNFTPTESNKALYIENKRAVQNVYAIKLRQTERYSSDNLQNVAKVWGSKLRQYIFYRTKYERLYGQLHSNNTEDTLKMFKQSNPVLNGKERMLSLDMKIKRLYLDSRSVLVHVTLEPNSGLVAPGTWDGLEIVSMKSVYYCLGFNSVPTLTLGNFVETMGCRNHMCVGDFNAGVQWVTTAVADCIARPATTLQNIVEVKTGETATTNTPGPTTIGISTDSSEEITETVPLTTSNSSTTNNHLPTTDNESITTENTTDLTSISTSTRPETTTLLAPDISTIESTGITINSGPPRPPTTKPTPTTPEPTTAEPTTTEAPTTTTPTTTTAIPREEQLQQVLDDLGRLVNNDSRVHVDDIAQVFDQVDDLLEDQDDLEIPGQLLHLLEQLASTVTLNGTGTGAAIRPNIALLIADAKPSNPIRGIRIASSGSDVFTQNAFEFMSQEPNSTMLSLEESEAVVNLPASVSQEQRRVSFVAFRNDRAFHAPTTYPVNSRVLSVNIEHVTHFTGGEVIEIHFNPMVSAPNRNESRACAYWHFLENGTGYWSQEGCTFIRSTQTGILDTCRCNHLTHFAEVLVPRSVFSQQNEDALEILTIIGCCISIFGLIMIGVTALLFRSWRREYSNKIWLQLCIAIFILILTFLIVIFVKFDEYNIFCMLIGVVLHYSLLASFCWMLVSAVLAYRRLVLVFTRDTSHKLLKASAFSWGLPCVVVGILLSVAPQSYAGQFEEKTPSGAFCYPSGLSLWLTVYTPIAIVLTTNCVLFALIVRSVFVSRGIQRHGETNEAIRCASVSCLLVFLFGLPWIFGLFATNIAAAYLFTLTATFQGFVLFVFFVLGNKKTRDLWLNKLKIKQTRKIPVTSSTYTNRSAEWRGGNPPMTLEAKVTKPKVLSSKDDSRFS